LHNCWTYVQRSCSILDFTGLACSFSWSWWCLKIFTFQYSLSFITPDGFLMKLWLPMKIFLKSLLLTEFNLADHWTAAEVLRASIACSDCVWKLFGLQMGFPSHLLPCIVILPLVMKNISWFPPHFKTFCLWVEVLQLLIVNCYPSTYELGKPPNWRSVFIIFCLKKGVTSGRFSIAAWPVRCGT